MARGSAQKIADKWAKMAARAEREFTKTMRGVGMSAVAFDKERMTEEIYAIPEDVSPRTGKKKWQRTHRLLKGEKYQVIDPFTVKIVNEAPYALYRHEAGKPGRRRINPLRESHWRDEMVKTFRSILDDAFELTMRDLLGRS